MLNEEGQDARQTERGNLDLKGAQQKQCFCSRQSYVTESIKGTKEGSNLVQSLQGDRNVIENKRSLCFGWIDLNIIQCLGVKVESLLGTFLSAQCSGASLYFGFFLITATKYVSCCHLY